MTDDPPMLSVDMLLRIGAFSGQTPGHALIHRFCSDVEAGNTPNTDDLKAVAYALRGISASGNMSESMDTVGHRLGLTKRQGKARSEGAQWFKRASEVAGYMLEVMAEIENGTSAKAAEMQVRTALSEKLGIGDRATRDMIKKYKEPAKLMLSAVYGVDPPALLWK